jgi:hypothetical protein
MHDDSSGLSPEQQLLSEVYEKLPYVSLMSTQLSAVPALSPFECFYICRFLLDFWFYKRGGNLQPITLFMDSSTTAFIIPEAVTLFDYPLSLINPKPQNRGSVGHQVLDCFVVEFISIDLQILRQSLHKRVFSHKNPF